MMGVIGNDDDALEAALGLGELADLTINNEADSLAYDVRNCKNSEICRNLVVRIEVISYYT